jgi:methionyl aminopeptidase
MKRVGWLVRRTLGVLRDHVRPGVTTGELEELAATERTAKAAGATVYGVGRTMHEPPSAPNVFAPHLRRPLNEGLVLAIEPMIGLGTPELVVRDDGWTIATADGSLAAHVEHTVMVGRTPTVLTA